MTIVPTLDELLYSDPDTFVAMHTDIAAVNLACARGLHNCDETEFPKYLELLDTIAAAVKRQTEKSFRLFKLKPQQFNNSENVYRLYTMEHVFRVQFGIKYDPVVREITESGKPWMSDDSSELFIHGLLSSKRTGTCSSLPTFAIAVGRRLGYPLKLILVPRHTLYRWDDGKEVFNLQPTAVGGEVKEDAFFHTSPEVWDEEDFRMNAHFKVWLHSLTPKQEVSKFLCNRALMLRDFGRYVEAFEAIDAAVKYNPMNPACPAIRDSIHYAQDGGDLPKLLAGEASTTEQRGIALKVVPHQNSGPWTTSLSACSNFGGATDFTSKAAIVGLAVSFHSSPRPAIVADQRSRQQSKPADEHFQRVQRINKSNRSRSPQHPKGSAPTKPWMRELTQLLTNRKAG